MPEHMDEGEQTKLQATCPLGDAAQISTMQLQRAGTMQAAGNFVQSPRNTPKQTRAAPLITMMQGSSYLPMCGCSPHMCIHTGVVGGCRVDTTDGRSNTSLWPPVVFADHTEFWPSVTDTSFHLRTLAFTDESN